MPYLGNSPVAGDHVNNFKVLDDISSHTATFDGSASTIVDTTNNTIRVVEHRFIQGQRVVYTNGGGGNIGGLTTGTAYFIIFDTAFTFKLATSASNAANSTAINLSSVGTGSSHTLNAAFDGVNTKFKITYQGGEPARFNNATQLNIAINNVIQRPNLSATTFTEGFAIEDHHKIVFKEAPTSEDIFWGSIIANTLTTFDISDHKIDTFTGDGSTTEFTLSHTPANNESLMVTINGVLQHPSNASTARAYTLIASIIQFTAAPGVGDEIQVRHLGFAGATTADVSGFYGRTGNVVLTSNDHITTGNINAGIVTATSFHGSFSPNVGGSNANFTGIVTAGVFKGGDIEGRNLKITGLSTFVGDASFTGNVSIGGTLTYEDVTNIDSVGLITARDGIKVGVGITLDTIGDAEFCGVVTFNNRRGGMAAHFPTNEMAVFGNNYLYGNIRNTGSELTFDALNKMRFNCWDGNSMEQWMGASGVSGSITLGGYFMGTGSGKAPRFQIQGSNHLIKMYSSEPNSTTLTERFSLSQSGINFTGLSTHTGNFDLDGDLDVDGHTNLDNVSIAGVTTIANNKELVIGEQADSQYNTVIKQIPSGSTGSLSLTTRFPRIYAHDTRIIDIDNGNTHAYFWPNQIGLYANGSEKIQITSGAVNITNANLSVSRDLDVDRHTNLDNVSIAGITTFTNGYFDLKPNGGGNAHFRILSTGTGDAGIFFDAANGDISGSDYVFIGQKNNLDFVINANANAGNIDFQRAGTTQVRIGSNGYVNIGTGTAEQQLTVQNSAQHCVIRVISKNTHDAGIDFGDTDNTDIAGVRYSNSDNSLKLNANAATRLKIDSAGRVMIGGGSSPTQVGDGRLIVYSTDRLHPAIKPAGMSNNYANGYSMIGDNYTATESQVNLGVSYSSGGLVLSRSVKVSGSADDTYLSSQAQYATRPCAIKLDSIGAFNFLTTETNANTAVDSAVSLTKVFTIDRVGNVYQRISARNMYFGASQQLRIGVQSNGDSNIEAVSGDLKIMDAGSVITQVRSDGLENFQHVYPANDNSKDLGKSTKRWANIYTTDLHLSNEGKSNVVDGTWGDWTLQEGEDKIFMINNRTGKKYSLKMEEE